jgi:hypothetical protein
MDLDEVEIDAKYRCDYDDGKQYVATVLEKYHRKVLVTLGDRINKDGDPGDPIHRMGTLGAIWVVPKQLHPM